MSPIDLTRRELLAGAGALAVAHLLPQQRPPAAPANVRVIASAKPPTLWVNGTTGSNSNTYAQVAAGGGSVAWRTISRAAKGCAPGGTPNAAEAAQAGDVVDIAAGTYTTTGTNSRWNVAYNPVNSGTAGNLITFQANGTVTLTYSSGTGPVIGASGVNYIQWIGFTIDEASAPSASDTGPVILNNTTGSVIDGCILDGNGSRFDNHNGVRIENATGCTVRNCIMHDFVATSGVANGNGICTFNATNSLLEHNEIYDCPTGISFKSGDVGATTARYNYFHNLSNTGVNVTLTHTGPLLIYQNLCVNCGGAIPANGLQLSGESPADVQLVNNTVVNSPLGFNYVPAIHDNAGIVLKNNIFATTEYALQFGLDDATAPSYLTKADIDSDSNCFYAFTINCVRVLRTGLSLAQWRATYAQDAHSHTSNPLFTNAAGGNYALGVGSPCINAGIDVLNLLGGGAERPINQGCYITGNETMGPQ